MPDVQSRTVEEQEAYLSRLGRGEGWRKLSPEELEHNLRMAEEIAEEIRQNEAQKPSEPS